LPALLTQKYRSNRRFLRVSRFRTRLSAEQPQSPAGLRFSDFSDAIVGVTSQAASQMGAPICVLGLDPAEAATMDFNGQASVDVKNCATQTNSKDGTGMHQVGQPNMKAMEIGVTGGYAGSNYSPKPIAGTQPIADPLAALPEPAVGACHPRSGDKLQQETVTLTPGTYCGGLTIMSQSVVTLMPGIYVMKDGPLLIQSGGTVRGDEVMIAFLGPSSVLYLYGDASLTVTSPTSGTYKNIQFFGDRKTYAGPGSNGANGENLWFSIIGDSRLSYDGVLYAPTFDVWFAGGSVVDGKSANYLAIAKKLWFQDKTIVSFEQVNRRGLSVEASVPLQYGARLLN
jgi:hypothetical protein